MKILAVDASTEACSVALLYNGTCQERYELAPRRHTELVLPMVDQLLAESGLQLSQLDALAFDKGPGSFTGVRVGTSVVQGLAYSTDLPVLGVSSLAALAQYALRTEQQTQVLAMIDARMNEVYWGLYAEQSGFMVLTNNEAVSPVQQISSAEQWHAIGSGWDNYKNELSVHPHVFVKSATEGVFPHAHDIALLAEVMFKNGEAITAEQALPTYVRDEVTWKKIAEQKG